MLALLWRAPELDLRPLHNDEAVNAIKFGDLWLKGNYKYDPNEYHGPTLYYFTLPFTYFSSAKDFTQLSEKTLRLTPLFFSLLAILILLLLKEELGKSGVIFASLFFAISPMVVFYSRYFIHETLLICFTTMLIVGGWRHAKSGKVGWAIFSGVGLGLMYATKETFVFSIAALISAIVLELGYSYRQNKKTLDQNGRFTIFIRPFLEKIRLKHITLALVTALVVSIPLYTSFFTNWNGPLDSIRTYLPWLERAGGKSPHIHPWYFYFERLLWFKPQRSPLWSEGALFIFALIGIRCGFNNRVCFLNKRFIRFITFYGLILAVIYSLISYKTPWCALGFWSGLLILAGAGAAELIDCCKNRWTKYLAILLLATTVVHISVMNYRANFVYYADRRNPYVYSQTVTDILRMAKTIDGISKVHPDGKKMVIKVISPDHDYWPLPWYLRSFENIGWYENLPKEPLPPIVIANVRLKVELDDKTNKDWLMVGLFEMRPRVFFELYVEFKWWEKYVMSLPKNRDDSN